MQAHTQEGSDVFDILELCLFLLLFSYTSTTQNPTHAGAYSSQWGGFFRSSSSPSSLKTKHMQVHTAASGVAQQLCLKFSLFYIMTTHLGSVALLLRHVALLRRHSKANTCRCIQQLVEWHSSSV